MRYVKQILHGIKRMLITVRWDDDFHLTWYVEYII